MPAEHTVNGQRADMEVHFVHLIHNSAGKDAACASSQRPLLVIGAFINAGGNSNTELQKLFPPDLPKSSFGPGARPRRRPECLGSFREPGLGIRRRLDGPSNDCVNFSPVSTQAVTGDFPEAVQWFIYSKQLQLPKSLMDRFSALFPEGDSRELKALNERTIFSLK